MEQAVAAVVPQQQQELSVSEQLLIEQVRDHPELLPVFLSLATNVSEDGLKVLGGTPKMAALTGVPARLEIKIPKSSKDHWTIYGHWGRDA